MQLHISDLNVNAGDFALTGTVKKASRQEASPILEGFVARDGTAYWTFADEEQYVVFGTFDWTDDFLGDMNTFLGEFQTFGGKAGRVLLKKWEQENNSPTSTDIESPPVPIIEKEDHMMEQSQTIHVVQNLEETKNCFSGGDSDDVESPLSTINVTGLDRAGIDWMDQGGTICDLASTPKSSVGEQATLFVGGDQKENICDVKCPLHSKKEHKHKSNNVHKKEHIHKLKKKKSSHPDHKKEQKYKSQEINVCRRIQATVN